MKIEIFKFYFLLSSFVIFNLVIGISAICLNEGNLFIIIFFMVSNVITSFLGGYLYLLIKEYKKLGNSIDW